MSATAATLMKLAELGLSAEQVAGVVAVMEEQEEVRKAKGRDRVRRHRENSAVKRDETLHPVSETPIDVTASKTKKVSPNPSKKTQPPREAPSPPSGAHGSSIGEPNGFARFWESYPNKVEKRGAERLWPAALKRAGSLEAILGGVDRAKTSRKWLEGYIRNPATWLRNDGWLDEPDDRSRAPPMTGGMVAAAAEELGYRMALEKLKERDDRRNYQRDQGVIIPLPEARQIASR